MEVLKAPTNIEIHADATPGTQSLGRLAFEETKQDSERQALENDLSKARTEFEYRRKERFMSERTQEIVERKFNERLTTVASLEEASLDSSSGVEKRFLDYEKTQIPVFDLKGYPFALLSHAIDYREINHRLGYQGIGDKTYQTLLENPSLWLESREEAERSSGFGTRNPDARGDVISASYVNSESNIDTRVGSRDQDYIHVCYGFEHLEGDSILCISPGDAGTSNVFGRNGRTSLTKSSVSSVETLEASPTTTYNEVVLRRYSDTGVPRKPDYIIAEDGKISDTMLRHANFFNIPILNIDRQTYEAKMRIRGKELLASVDETSSYENIYEVFDKVSRLSPFKQKLVVRENYGRAQDSFFPPAYSELERQCRAFRELEFKKRLEFLSQNLDDMKVDEKASSFAFFSVREEDVENGLSRSLHADQPTTLYQVPGNVSRLTIDFRLEGSTKTIRTSLYDGEHPYKLEAALASGAISESDLAAADSAPYLDLKPKADRFIDSFRKTLKTA